MIAKIHTFKLNGIEAIPVTVECEVTPGIGIHLVGLADAAVRESLLRTVTALQSHGYQIPGKKVVINLVPADLRKSGAGFDLPIALGILSASGQEELPDLDKYVLAGELGLDGSLRDIPGWMQIAELAMSQGRACILPTESAKLAALAIGHNAPIYGVDNLKEVIEILNDGTPDWTAMDDVATCREQPDEDLLRRWWNTLPGNARGKRALEIAAAGGHPVLIIGAPGSAKAQLVRALNEILPPMSKKETDEVNRIYSACARGVLNQRPFRAPHFSASMTALLGGGSGDNILPGEVSLAHNGTLCIDEITCVPKIILEGLLGPIEDGKVTISRLKSKIEFPAKFHLVATTAPCPCGYYGEGDRCTCTPAQREAFLARLSGPVFDKFTMRICVHPESDSTIIGDKKEVVSERVQKARERQIERQGKLNDDLDATEAEEACGIIGETEGERIFNVAWEFIKRNDLSAKAYSRILKMARTIADLEGADDVTAAHIAEAASYREFDREEI